MPLSITGDAHHTTQHSLLLYVPSFQQNAYSTESTPPFSFTNVPFPLFCPSHMYTHVPGKCPYTRISLMTRKDQLQADIRVGFKVKASTGVRRNGIPGCLVAAAPRAQRETPKKQQQKSSSLPMACAQEGTEISSPISHQCPGEGTGSWVRGLERRGACAVGALRGDASVEFVGQQADHSEGLASNVSQAGTLKAQRTADKNALRQGITPHDREVGTSAACGRGVGENGWRDDGRGVRGLQDLIYKSREQATAQSRSPLVTMFTMEAATPPTSRGTQRIPRGFSGAQEERKMGKCWRLYFFLIMWNSWPFWVVSSCLVLPWGSL